MNVCVQVQVEMVLNYGTQNFGSCYAPQQHPQYQSDSKHNPKLNNGLMETTRSFKAVSLDV